MTDTQGTPRRSLVPGPTPPSAGLGPAKAADITGTEIAARSEQVLIRDALVRLHPPPVANIAKAISTVMGEVGTVHKGGTLSFSGNNSYKYVRMEDLLQKLTPLMAKVGIAVIQNEVERAVQNNNLAMTYEFSILHSSGEVWPERPRFTGMSAARDDKAINKCHTAARKYFLLSLFQVPTGDVDDADEGATAAPTQAPPQQQRRPVPGPAPHRQPADDEGRSAPTPPPRPVPAPAPAQESTLVQEATWPHKIVLGPSAGADGWAAAYIKHLGEAKTTAELHQWDQANDQILQRLSDAYTPIYEMIATAFQRRMEDLTAAPAGEQVDADTGEVMELSKIKMALIMPDPKVDPTVAVNWVGQQLTEFKTWDAAATFWDAIVMPQADKFMPEDFDLLQAELRRAEARLAA